MRKRIFIGTFLASLAVCGASLCVILGALYGYYSKLYDDEIASAATYISEGIELSGMQYLQKSENFGNKRVTLIAADGSVIFDSMTDPEKMENHADREEFIEAKSSGRGTAARLSQTLSQRTYYYAVLLDDGSVLRVGGTQHTPLSLLLNMIQPLLIVLIVAVALSYLLAAYVSKKIIRPINAIDFDAPEHIEGYGELDPLVDNLQRKNEQIERHIAEIHAAHESQDRMRREFTANVSHELKTPLTSISGFAEIIRDGLVKPEDIPRFAGNIYSEAGRLITLVEDIIKVSRLEECPRDMEMSNVDLYEQCEIAVSRLRQAAERRGITLSLTGERLCVFGSEQIIGEMIENVCDNAVKYNVDGGRVDVSVTRCEGGAEVAVRDTGIGIPPEDIDHVFERFYRVNKSHSKEIGGTGLGLSIVKHGALFHGATVSIASEPDRGTEICIRFRENFCRE